MTIPNDHIVIVHIPKTAGTSLKESIAAKFDVNEICFDYHQPLAKIPSLRKIQCLVSSVQTRRIEQHIIFGHFLAGKYADFSKLLFCKRKGWTYITFLRDPLQRAISHYHFWKRTHHVEHRIWRRFTRENWTLERFLLCREFENFQSQFLWRFPISNFDFIGIAEHFEESLQMLGYMLPEFHGLSIRADNSHPEKRTGDRYSIDASLAEEFMRHNAEDYAIYNQAMEIFEQQRHRFRHKGPLQ